MKDPVYKLIELTGTSTTSIEDAIEKAIKRANKTVKHLSWFQVTETRGHINKGKPQYGTIYDIVHHADDPTSDHLNVSISGILVILDAAQHALTLEFLYDIFSAITFISFFSTFPDILFFVFVSTVCSQCFTWQHSV